MKVLALDTATSATAVAVQRGDGSVVEARHDPGPGERPGHAGRLLALIDQALAEAEDSLDAIDRLAVGTGPGSFTGLRIGIATARGLAQAQGIELVGVSTLLALAEAAAERADEATVLAMIDARRGEAFAAAWSGGRDVLAPAALGPDALRGAVSELPTPILAVGEGAIRFRLEIEPAGAAVPPDDDLLHRVSARPMCRLAAAAKPDRIEAVLPEYLRLPDAETARRH